MGELLWSDPVSHVGCLPLHPSIRHASNHMCNKTEIFIELDEEGNSNMSLGDSSKLQVKGKGKIKFS